MRCTQPLWFCTHEIRGYGQTSHSGPAQYRIHGISHYRGGEYSFFKILNCELLNVYVSVLNIPSLGSRPNNLVEQKISLLD